MKKIFYLFLVIFINTAYAQKEIATQSNAWVLYLGNHRISDRWGVHTEYQWRRSGFFEHWQQSLTRFGLDYYTKTGVQYTAGYAWVLTYPYGNQPIQHQFTEHRIWQQVILKNKIQRVEVQHRYRLEQRFLEQWAKNTTHEFGSTGFVFRQRARYRFLLNVPLNKDEMADKTLFLSLSDEVFLGFGKGIGKNILDQNRINAAIGWRFDSNSNIQLGYLNHYLVKSDGIKAERNHTLQLGFTYNLDFRKQN
ncbi:MAG: DUF2490 domain-containing protein [Bacteroidota bacterium]